MSDENMRARAEAAENTLRLLLGSSDRNEATESFIAHSKRLTAERDAALARVRELEEMKPGVWHMKDRELLRKARARIAELEGALRDCADLMQSHDDQAEGCLYDFRQCIGEARAVLEKLTRKEGEQ